MNSQEPLLEARDLTRRFQGLVAVKRVSFSIEQHEIVCLIGPNGAGKTTIVSLISGTLFPNEGELYFKSARIERLAPNRRAHLGIARTFQVMKPFRDLSVLENVTVGALFGFGGGERNRSRAKSLAREMVEFTGLTRKMDQRAEDLGGPDRKRLELAKALAMRPRLLLLDEVMAGLNPAEIREVVEIIKKIRQQGVTILLIEHIIQAVRSLADRIVVLHHGQKITEGDPKSVLADSRVVEAYLGKRRA
jgi:branched-chain amino acid transport system ATP-binding protein